MKMPPLAIERLVAKACDYHGIPFAKINPHSINDYLDQMVNNFTHPEGVKDINSFLTRGLEEDKIEGQCSTAGVEYLPPAQRETTKETHERRQLLMRWCRDAEGVSQLKSPPEKIGVQTGASASINKERMGDANPNANTLLKRMENEFQAIVVKHRSDTLRLLKESAAKGESSVPPYRISISRTGNLVAMRAANLRVQKAGGKLLPEGELTGLLGRAEGEAVASYKNVIEKTKEPESKSMTRSNVGSTHQKMPESGSVAHKPGSDPSPTSSTQPNQQDMNGSSISAKEPDQATARSTITFPSASSSLLCQSTSKPSAKSVASTNQPALGSAALVNGSMISSSMKLKMSPVRPTAKASRTLPVKSDGNMLSLSPSRPLAPKTNSLHGINFCSGETTGDSRVAMLNETGTDSTMNQLPAQLSSTGEAIKTSTAKRTKMSSKEKLAASYINDSGVRVFKSYLGKIIKLCKVEGCCSNGNQRGRLCQKHRRLADAKAKTEGSTALPVASDGNMTSLSPSRPLAPKTNSLHGINFCSGETTGDARVAMPNGTDSSMNQLPAQLSPTGVAAKTSTVKLSTKDRLAASFINKHGVRVYKTQSGLLKKSAAKGESSVPAYRMSITRSGNLAAMRAANLRVQKEGGKLLPEGELTGLLGRAEGEAMALCEKATSAPHKAAPAVVTPSAAGGKQKASSSSVKSTQKKEWLDRERKEKAVQINIAKAKAAQARAAEARAAQVEAKQSRAARVKAAQARAAEARAAQVRARQARAAQAKANIAKVAQARAAKMKATAAKATPVKVSPAKVTPAAAGGKRKTLPGSVESKQPPKTLKGDANPNENTMLKRMENEFQAIVVKHRSDTLRLLKESAAKGESSVPAYRTSISRTQNLIAMRAANLRVQKAGGKLLPEGELTGLLGRAEGEAVALYKNDIEKDPKPAQSKSKTSSSAGSTNRKLTAGFDSVGHNPDIVIQLKGTLSYSDSYEIPRIHIIRGEWTSITGPQSFELFRRIPSDEDLKELPKDGEYEGSFNLPLNRKVKGKAKPRTRVVMESGVKLRFTTNNGEEGNFSVIGLGANEFGAFRLDGTATKNARGEGVVETFSLFLNKTYDTHPIKKLGKRKRESTSPPHESNGRMEKRRITGSDHNLAASLQLEEVRLAKEEDDMLSTPQGIAYMFVERVLKECKKLQPDQNVGIKSVAVDDMVHQAEGLLKCQETFKSMGKDTSVDIGYHFTKASAMNHIQRDGLMTMSDRDANPKLSPHQSRSRHGGVFGDGVYTGNDPFTFKKYGDIGLLVARLRGKTRRIKPEECELRGTLSNPSITPKGPLGQEALSKGYDSIIGNKTRFATPNNDEVVLLRSSQCIPLIRFPVSVVSNIQNRVIPAVLHSYIDAMEKVVAEFFNNGPPNPSISKTTLKSALIHYTVGKGDASKPQSKQPKATVLQSKVATGVASTATTSNTTTKTGLTAATGAPNANSGMTTRVASATAPSTATAKTVVQRKMRSLQANALSGSTTGASNANNTTATGVASSAGSPIASMKTAQTGQKIPPAFIGKEIVIYDAPEKLPHSCLVEDLNCNDVLTLADQKCTICLEKLAKSSDLLKVKKCQHIFCRECILQSLQICRRCPSCQNHIGEPQGKSPSGQMIIAVDDTTRCAGYGNSKTIVITYNLWDGKQKIYHEEEGKQFKGTRRIAYLPDNDDGRRLLERLKSAFRCGLTFCVGTSMTSGKSGVITWGSIHHKTSPCNGSHGWPDETYFVQCNRELDCLGVPKVDKVGYL